MSIFSAPWTSLTSNCLYEMFSKINALFNSCYRYFVYKSSLQKHNVAKILPFYLWRPLKFSYLRVVSHLSLQLETIKRACKTSVPKTSQTRKDNFLANLQRTGKKRVFIWGYFFVRAYVIAHSIKTETGEMRNSSKSNLL